MLILSKVPGNCGLVTLSCNDSTFFTKKDIQSLVKNYETSNNTYNSIRQVMAFTNKIRGSIQLKKAGFVLSDSYEGNSGTVRVMLWDRNSNMKEVVPFKTKLKKYLTNLINKI